MKTKIRFVYHKPKGEFRLWPPRLIGSAIVGLTWIYALFYGKGKALKYNYSHEEVWLPDENGEFGGIKPCGKRRIDNAHQVLFKGECFSSTTRGEWKGVRFAPAYEVLKHPDRWDYIEVEVDSERLEVAVAEAHRLVGAGYDFLGILGFLNPFPVQNKIWWYCSEVCHWFKRLCYSGTPAEKRISPRRSAYKLAKAWGEPKALQGSKPQGKSD